MGQANDAKAGFFFVPDLSSIVAAGTIEQFDVVIQELFTDHESQVLVLRTNTRVTLPTKHLVAFDITKVGDRFDTKLCDRCFKLLPTEEMFSNNRLKKGDVITKRPSCKTCRKLKDGVNVSRADRETWGKARPKDFSPFKCPICEKTTSVGVTKVVLDHCHKTGRVRGWVCESCNTGIGRFDDSPDIVKRAISWLA